MHRKTGRGQWIHCLSPPMQCGPSLYKDWPGLIPTDINILSPQGHINPSTGWLCGGFCTIIPSVSICFHFPALALVLLLLVCSQFQMLLFHQAGPLGLSLGKGWGGDFGALPGAGRTNEISRLLFLS